jgi:cyclic pyranopterin phosphate synthase
LRVSSLGKLHLCLFGEQGLSLKEQLQCDDVEPLKKQIISLLGDKQATHYLHEKLSGATTNLSMLGG